MPKDAHSYSFQYCSHYCEENVWRLACEPQFHNLQRKVVVISNQARKCLLWRQRAAPKADDYVCWDYHVVLFVLDRYWFVWDLDTVLSLPVRAEEYLSKTFPDRIVAATFLAPRFRIFDGAEYVETFRSDRSHMRDKNGQWLAPPPPWPPILGNGPLTFAAMIDFRAGIEPETVPLLEMYKRFGAA
jgi:protein N-terminal glutamine amidohydrolase